MSYCECYGYKEFKLSRTNRLRLTIKQTFRNQGHSSLYESAVHINLYHPLHFNVDKKGRRSSSLSWISSDHVIPPCVLELPIYVCIWIKILYMLSLL